MLWTCISLGTSFQDVHLQAQSGNLKQAQRCRGRASTPWRGSSSSIPTLGSTKQKQKTRTLFINYSFGVSSFKLVSVKVKPRNQIRSFSLTYRWIVSATTTSPTALRTVTSVSDWVCSLEMQFLKQHTPWPAASPDNSQLKLTRLILLSLWLSVQSLHLLLRWFFFSGVRICF